MMNRRNILHIAVLMLPLLICLLMIARAGMDDRGTVYRLSIEGYDPRDVLRGRYLTFRYTWPTGIVATQCSAGQECGLCLSHDGDRVTGFMTRNREGVTKDTCPDYVLVQAKNLYHTPAAAFSLPGRFYLPESKAPEVERLFRSGNYRFSVDAVVVRGKLKPQMLYLNDEPWMTVTD